MGLAGGLAANGQVGGQVPASVVTGVPASGDTTGATDLAALNAALNTARLNASPAYGGLVRGMSGSTYYINDRIVVGSYVTLDMTGCTVIQVANTNKRITTNYSWMNPVGSASDASMTSGQYVITSPTLAPLAANGMSITVAGAAGPSGVNAVPLCGIITNVNTGTNQITVRNLDGTTNLTAGNTVSAAAAVLYNRDVKPKVIGGFWDRGTLNHSGGASDQSVHSFHHCDYPYVHPEGVYSQLGADSGHCIDFADVTHAFGQIDHCDYRGVAVQITGPAYGVEIPRIVGKTTDDAFAITASDWATNLIETSGNVVGVRVGHIDVSSGMRLVNIIAGVGNLVDDVKVEKVRGTGGNTIGTICIGDDVASASTTGGTYGSIEIRGIAGFNKMATRCVNLISPAFKKIKLELDYPPLPTDFAAPTPYVEMTGASSVFPQQLEISGYVEYFITQANENVYSQTSTSAQLDHLIVHDLNFDQNAYSGNLVALKTNSRINNIDIARVRHNIGSNAYAAAMVSIASGATLANLRFIGGLAWNVQTIVSDLSTTARNIEFAGGFLAQAPANVVVFNAASGSQKVVKMDGCVFNSVSGVAISTTGAPVNVQGSGLSTTGTFTMLTRAASEVVRSLSPELPFDVTALARTGVGDMCNNTNGAAACGAGIVVSSGAGSAGSWKNLFSGATY